MQQFRILSAATLAFILSCSFTSYERSASLEPAVGSPSAPQEATAGQRSIPGGGRILFQDEGFDGDFGVVESDGTVHRFRQRRGSFPYWDPANEHRILIVPHEAGAARSLLALGDRLVEVERWKLRDGYFSSFTRDGRGIIGNVFDERGRLDDRQLLFVDRRSGEAVREPVFREALDTLDLPALLALDLPAEPPWTRAADLVGSPDLRSFAGQVSVPTSRSAIAVWRRSGERLALIPNGARNVSVPTWSPDGRRIAFIVRGPEPEGHLRASLVVHDVPTGTTEVIARPVSDAFWASWSPDGRWLLVDDWTRGRWLFVAVDGGRIVPYPSLGAMPRWCCPSSPPIEVRYPVC
jgi:hypothetical protein